MYNTTYRAKNLGKHPNGSKRTIKFIVLHDTCGNGGLGDVKYLANDPEKRGVSVDFVVPKDGTVYQLSPDLNKYWTYHAGSKTTFRGHANSNVNIHSIGIEIGQKANMTGLVPLYPHVQVHAVARLCRDLCERYSLTKTDITTHAKIKWDGSRSDPRNFPFDEFWEIFSVQDAAQPGTPHLNAPIRHIVVDGDTLYNISTRYLTSVEKIKGLNNLNTASNTIRVGQDLLVKQ